MQEPEILKQIYEIKGNFNQLNTVVDRIDETLHQLAHVSKNLSELIAVQDNRLTNQEKFTSHLLTMIEREKTATHTSDKEIEKSIQSLEKELYKEIEQTKKSIVDELKQMKAEHASSMSALNDKISKLERLVWIATGGGMVIAFILTKLSSPLMKLFQ